MSRNNILEIKKSIIKYGAKLGEKNMSPATSGNISVRVENNILITASGTCLADLSEDEIVLMDKHANVIEGSRKPSSEKNLHIAIYEMRPDINAIVHCHSPYASAFAVCQMSTVQNNHYTKEVYLGRHILLPFIKIFLC